MSTFNMLSKFLIYCIVRENRDSAEFIDVTWYIEHRHDSKAPYNRRARFSWRPDSTRVISMVLSQFRATNQTHKVWPNMDTSPLNEWHTHTQISVWWGSLHDGELLREAPGLSRITVPQYLIGRVLRRTCVSIRATIALPPRCVHAGRLTNREGKTENPESLHTWCRIVSEYGSVSNGQRYRRIKFISWHHLHMTL